MAKANWRLVQILRITADRIEETHDYHWAHVGKCNCGHLAQTITGLSASDLFQKARTDALAEWTEYAKDYCPQTGQPLEEIIAAMLNCGLERRDLHRLEYLSDARVLAQLPGGMRYLRRYRPSDVALYMRTWANLLEEELEPADDENLVPFPDLSVKQA